MHLPFWAGGDGHILWRGVGLANSHGRVKCYFADRQGGAAPGHRIGACQCNLLDQKLGHPAHTPAKQPKPPQSAQPETHLVREQEDYLGDHLQGCSRSRDKPQTGTRSPWGGLAPQSVEGVPGANNTSTPYFVPFPPGPTSAESPTDLGGENGRLRSIDRKLNEKRNL